MVQPRQNYLNNRDMLAEIHRSKNSFSSYTRPEYHQYDIILSSIDDITPITIEQARRQHAKRQTDAIFNIRRLEGERVKLSECEVDISKIRDQDLIFRIMTFDHIPKNATRKKTYKTISDHYEKVNFPPFQHWKFNDLHVLECVGKSHWKGPVDTGYFNRDAGGITNNLAKMMIKLCERYSTRSNVRNYCVDDKTQALTQRGWLSVDDITEDDIILSYSEGSLKWSSILSIYRNYEYNGKMVKMIAPGLDTLMTHDHKMVTTKGLIPANELKSSNELVLLGTSVKDLKSSNDINIDDLIMKLKNQESSEKIDQQIIMSLTENQRKLIIQDLFGEYHLNNRYRISVKHIDYEKIDIIQTICTLSGIKFNYNIVHDIDTQEYYIDYVLSNQYVLPMYDVKMIDAQGSEENNVWTIWCPETEYGCFIARRNGTVYLTSNTYNDEMRGQAILQLTQVGLQFDESKSDNPFGYFSQVVTNSFLRILNIEKKNQNIRDDILELNGMNPSFTRIHNSEYEYEMKRNSYHDDD